MQRPGHSPPATDDKIQVFVSSTSLNFYTDDTSSHQVAVTIYNPYDFSLKYRVTSTAPKKYRVCPGEGIIKPRYCADIVFRHRDVCTRNEHVRDKFRIQVMKPGERTVIGKKDIVSMLLPTIDRTQTSEDNFESITQHQERLQSISGSTSRPFTPVDSSRPSWIVILAAIVAVAFLMLPSKVSEDSPFPEYLCVNETKKLVAAYILGLVTMYFFRS